MTVGIHRVRATSLTGAVADLDCEVAEVSIHHGRDAPSGQPEPSSATITIPASALPPEVEVGAAVTVDTQDDLSAWRPRFVGKVTDLAVTWHGGGDDPVAVPEAVVTAVGPVAQLGRRYVGDVPWPMESDGARVARVMALVGGTSVVDPGTVNVLARDVDLRSALEVITDVAVSAGGILWETVAGVVSYADADHRHGTPVGVTLDACDVLMAPVWTRNVEGLVNDVAVSYGLAPEGGSEQPTYAANRPESITAYGRYAYALRTELAALADAQERAQLLLVRNSRPAWNMTSLPLDLSILDAVTTRAILALDMHSLLGLTGLPAGAPATSVVLWVEGWSETLRYGGHELTLAVSDYCRTSPPPTWDEVPPSWTWDTVGGVVVTDNLVTNPSMETASGTVVVRENLITNPVAGVDASLWNLAAGGGVAAGARMTGQTGVWGFGATTAFRATWSTGATQITGGVNVYAPGNLVVPGRTYGAAMQIRCSRTQRLQAYISFRDAAGAVIPGGDVTDVAVIVPANTVTTFRVTAKVAPAGAANAYIYVYAASGASGTMWAAGDWLEGTNAHVEETDVALEAAAGPNRTDLTGIFAGWFGAGTYGADYTYGWAGTAHASRSQMKAPAVVGTDSPQQPATAVSQSTDRAVIGTKSLRVLFGTYAFAQTWARVPVAGLVPGKTYTASASLYVPAGGPSVCLSVSGGQGDGPTITVKDQWVRTSVTWTEPSATSRFLLPAQRSATVRGDDRCYVDAVQVEEGATFTDYLDGSLPDTATTDYAWLGAAHASVSRRITPLPPTWDGATCFGPLPSSGRWADVPASTRWDEVPPGTTWDTWKG